MREPISLKEILAVIVKRGWGILLTALVLAMALGAYQGKTQVDLSRLPENSPEYIEAEYQANLANYEAQKNGLQNSLGGARITLDRQRNYIEGSILMKIDAYNAVKCVQMLSIELLDDNKTGALDQSEDRYNRMVNKVQNFYQNHFNGDDLAVALQNLGLVTEDRFLREIISMEISNGFINLTVYGQTAEDTQRMANVVSQWLIQLSQSGAADVYAHKLTLMSSTPKTEIAQWIGDHHTTHWGYLNSCEATVVDLENQLANLAAPEKRAGYSMTEMLKATIKWVILGAVIGVILSCAWVLVLFLFRSRVESSRQMEQVLGIPFLGSAAKRGSIWKRLADRILVERVWEDPAQAQEYLIESLRNAGVADGLLVLTTLEEKNKQMELQLVEQAAVAAGAQVLCVAKAEENAQTVTGLQTYQRVILAEGVGKSEVPKMRSLQAMAQRMGAEVVGFVTI